MILMKQSIVYEVSSAWLEESTVNMILINSSIVYKVSTAFKLMDYCDE